MPSPNVLVILADDLGYSDIASFGGEIDTPNLDRLAARGVRMEQFYVTPRCSPSRAALLTGRQPHSVGIGILTRDDSPTGYAGSLSTEVPTLAEILGEQGYLTAVTGKWHLSSDTRSPNPTWPTRRGFERFHGILPGCSSFYQPELYEGERRIELADAFYMTDDISAYAVDVVRTAAQEARPFFLFAAYTAPHWPLHAREEDVAKYRERYTRGWDILRKERQARQGEIGLGIASVESAPDSQVGAWSDAPDQAWEVERMAVYAAQVEVMDRGIGSILDALEESGQLDNTLIVFSSDNGACAEEFSVELGEYFGEDICPRTTRDGRPVRVGNDPLIMPGPEDTYMSYGRSWAHLSNTPFRLYKRWVHEGGISSPMIASWPAGSLRTGEVIRDPAHLVDIAPTILEAVGLAGRTDGRSLLDTWRGGAAAEEERVLYWEHIGNAAVRRGRWKLVRETLADWELFDVVADRGETTNLAAEHPDLVAELTQLWEIWALETGVILWEDVLADYERRGRDLRLAQG
jgi:arylsulfatase A-like enzyme